MLNIFPFYRHKLLYHFYILKHSALELFNPLLTVALTPPHKGENS